MAEPPAIRASDAEREAAASRLRAAGAEGRLTVEELDERLERAYGARTLAELDALEADLPRRAPGSAPDRPGTGLARRVSAYVPITIMLVVVWAVSGAGYFWPIWPIIGFAMAIFGWHGGFHGRHGHRRDRRDRGLPPPEGPTLPPAP